MDARRTGPVGDARVSEVVRRRARKRVWKVIFGGMVGFNVLFESRIRRGRGIFIEFCRWFGCLCWELAVNNK